ncbi:MAG: Ldh family oxidoreductase [Pirellulales bacterium]
MRRILAGELTEFATAVLHAGGVGAEEARLVAESLVGANLRGHDSHGVMRVPYYLKQVAAGECMPGAEFVVRNETASLLVADGNWGFGQTQAQRLTRRLIDKALGGGVGLGTLVHSCHIGRLGEYCELAAAAGLCSLVMVNTHGAARRVAPPGGKSPRLGTNPLALGAPNGAGPLVLDFGTSATAEGKVRVKRIAGQLCPDGWLLDSEGRPTNDPNTLYGDPPGTIRPMGGDQSYKGFGLALMIELFAGALAGGLCIREKPSNQLGNCVFMMLVNPAALGGAEHFAREVTELDAFVRGCPRIDGCDEILLPGDPERRVLAERTANGIPVDDGNWNELVKEAARLGVREK